MSDSNIFGTFGSFFKSKKSQVDEKQQGFDFLTQHLKQNLPDSKTSSQNTAFFSSINSTQLKQDDVPSKIIESKPAQVSDDDDLEDQLNQGWGDNFTDVESSFSEETPLPINEPAPQATPFEGIGNGKKNTKQQQAAPREETSKSVETNKRGVVKEQKKLDRIDEEEKIVVQVKEESIRGGAANTQKSAGNGGIRSDKQAEESQRVSQLTSIASPIQKVKPQSPLRQKGKVDQFAQLIELEKMISNERQEMQERYAREFNQLRMWTEDIVAKEQELSEQLKARQLLDLKIKFKSEYISDESKLMNLLSETKDQKEEIIFLKKSLSEMQSLHHQQITEMNKQIQEGEASAKKSKGDYEMQLAELAGKVASLKEQDIRLKNSISQKFKSQNISGYFNELVEDMQTMLSEEKQQMKENIQEIGAKLIKEHEQVILVKREVNKLKQECAEKEMRIQMIQSSANSVQNEQKDFYEKKLANLEKKMEADAKQNSVQIAMKDQRIDSLESSAKSLQSNLKIQIAKSEAAESEQQKLQQQKTQQSENEISEIKKELSSLRNKLSLIEIEKNSLEKKMDQEIKVSKEQKQKVSQFTQKVSDLETELVETKQSSSDKILRLEEAHKKELLLTEQKFQALLKISEEKIVKEQALLRFAKTETEKQEESENNLISKIAYSTTEDQEQLSDVSAPQQNVPLQKIQEQIVEIPVEKIKKSQKKPETNEDPFKQFDTRPTASMIELLSAKQVLPQINKPKEGGKPKETSIFAGGAKKSKNVSIQSKQDELFLGFLEKKAGKNDIMTEKLNTNKLIEAEPLKQQAEIEDQSKVSSASSNSQKVPLIQAKQPEKVAKQADNYQINEKISESQTQVENKIEFPVPESSIISKNLKEVKAAAVETQDLFNIKPIINPEQNETKIPQKKLLKAQLAQDSCFSELLSQSNKPSNLTQTVNTDDIFGVFEETFKAAPKKKGKGKKQTQPKDSKEKEEVKTCIENNDEKSAVGNIESDQKCVASHELNNNDLQNQQQQNNIQLESQIEEQAAAEEVKINSEGNQLSDGLENNNIPESKLVLHPTSQQIANIEFHSIEPMKEVTLDIFSQQEDIHEQLSAQYVVSTKDLISKSPANLMKWSSLSRCSGASFPNTDSNSTDQPLHYIPAKNDFVLEQLRKAPIDKAKEEYLHHIQKRFSFDYKSNFKPQKQNESFNPSPDIKPMMRDASQSQWEDSLCLQGRRMTGSQEMSIRQNNVLDLDNLEQSDEKGSIAFPTTQNPNAFKMYETRDSNQSLRSLAFSNVHSDNLLGSSSHHMIDYFVSDQKKSDKHMFKNIQKLHQSESGNRKVSEGFSDLDSVMERSNGMIGQGGSAFYESHAPLHSIFEQNRNVASPQSDSISSKHQTESPSNNQSPRQVQQFSLANDPILQEVLQDKDLLIEDPLSSSDQNEQKKVLENLVVSPISSLQKIELAAPFTRTTNLSIIEGTRELSTFQKTLFQPLTLKQDSSSKLEKDSAEELAWVRSQIGSFEFNSEKAPNEETQGSRPIATEPELELEKFQKTEEIESVVQNAVAAAAVISKSDLEIDENLDDPWNNNANIDSQSSSQKGVDAQIWTNQELPDEKEEEEDTEIGKQEQNSSKIEETSQIPEQQPIQNKVESDQKEEEHGIQENKISENETELMSDQKNDLQEEIVQEQIEQLEPELETIEDLNYHQNQKREFEQSVESAPEQFPEIKENENQQKDEVTVEIEENKGGEQLGEEQEQEIAIDGDVQPTQDDLRQESQEQTNNTNELVKSNQDIEQNIEEENTEVKEDKVQIEEEIQVDVQEATAQNETEVDEKEIQVVDVEIGENQQEANEQLELSGLDDGWGNNNGQLEVDELEQDIFTSSKIQTQPITETKPQEVEDYNQAQEESPEVPKVYIEDKLTEEIADEQQQQWGNDLDLDLEGEDEVHKKEDPNEEGDEELFDNPWNQEEQVEMVEQPEVKAIDFFLNSLNVRNNNDEKEPIMTKDNLAGNGWDFTENFEEIDDDQKIEISPQIESEWIIPKQPSTSKSPQQSIAEKSRNFSENPFNGLISDPKIQNSSQQISSSISETSLFESQLSKSSLVDLKPPPIKNNKPVLPTSNQVWDIFGAEQGDTQQQQQQQQTLSKPKKKKKTTKGKNVNEENDDTPWETQPAILIVNKVNQFYVKAAPKNPFLDSKKDAQNQNESSQSFQKTEDFFSGFQ